jgi:hypothetical protein
VHQTTLYKTSGYVEGAAAGATLSQLQQVRQSPFGPQGGAAQAPPMSMPSIPGMPFATAPAPVLAGAGGGFGPQQTGYGGYSGPGTQGGMMQTGMAGVGGTPAGGGWQNFFNQGDWTPAQSFTSLAQAFFMHLDTNKTGYLTPEQYSAFLDACGYPPSQNTWRNAANTANPYSGVSRESQADTALKRAYESFGIEHQLGTRSHSSVAFDNRMNPASAPMPLITLNGFTKLTGYEVLFDPAKGHADLNRAMKNLGLSLGRERGEIPRWVLPETAPPGILQRAQQVQRQATQQQTGGPLQVGGFGAPQGMNVGGGMYYGQQPAYR